MSAQPDSAPFAAFAYRFRAELTLSELRECLSTVGTTLWFARRLAPGVEYLTTPTSAWIEERLRIHLAPPDQAPADGAPAYQLAVWYPQGADRNDQIDSMWGEVLLPADAQEVEALDPALALTRGGGTAASAECTGFDFVTPLSLSDMRDRLIRQTGERWVLAGDDLRVTLTSAGEGQEARYRLHRQGMPDNCYRLELLYRGTPHDEYCWRDSCASARNQVLLAVDAKNIAELDELTLEGELP